MKRDLVKWSEQEGITPADPESFRPASCEENKKKNACAEKKCCK